MAREQKLARGSVFAWVMALTGAVLAFSFVSDTARAAPALVDASATQLQWAATSPAGADVTLDGSLSSSDSLMFAWWENCPVVDCAGGTRLTADSAEAVIATVPLSIGSHEIFLWATDGAEWAVAAPITVTVSDVPATARAGQDQRLPATGELTSVTLDGSRSTNAVSYSWSVDGTEVATSAVATVSYAPGVYEATLTVTSVGGVPSTDTMVFTILPLANAGEDQTLVATSQDGAFVTLDGSGSIGEITDWLWSAKFGSHSVDGLMDGDVGTIELLMGTYEITLTVIDAHGNRDSDTATIVVLLPEGEPVVSISPTRGVAPSVISYRIDLFPSIQDVAVELVRPGTAPILLDTVETDIIGRATSNHLTIPETAGGPIEIRFTSGDTVVSTTFEVTPRISVSPGTVSPGDIVDVSLRGYAAQEAVLIRWRIDGVWVPVGAATTSGNGSANVSVTVPPNADEGQNSVRGDGPSFRAQTNGVTVVGAVLPRVEISTSRGTVNTWVNYTVTGFPANADVAITWKRPGGSVVNAGAAQTDADGAATGRIRVPATTGGDNTIVFQSGGTIVTTTYEVAPRIKVTPGTVEPGQTVDVSLRGFGKNETVRIRWRIDGVWVEVATVTTSNTGSANVTVTVPANADAGQNSVRGDGPSFRAQTNAATVVP